SSPRLPHSHLFFFLMLPPPPTSPLFPYTTLFRSKSEPAAAHDLICSFVALLARRLPIVAGVVIEVRAGPFDDIAGEIQNSGRRFAVRIGVNISRIVEPRLYGVSVYFDPLIAPGVKVHRGAGFASVFAARGVLPFLFGGQAIIQSVISSL